MVPEATRPTTEVKRLLTILPDQDATWGSASRPSVLGLIGSRQEERKGCQPRVIATDGLIGNPECKLG